MLAKESWLIGFSLDLGLAICTRHPHLRSMTNVSDATRSILTAASPSKGAGVFHRREVDQATSWFVPPIVVPALFLVLIALKAAYSAFV